MNYEPSSMKAREFKDLVFQEIAVIAQAFSSPKRLEIIDVLAQGERSVEALARQVSMTVANTSQHLQILKNARVVTNRKDGVNVIYFLTAKDVLHCWKALQALAAKRRSEIKEIVRLFFEESKSLEPIPRDELWRRLRKNEVVLLDVRPPEEYKQEHLPGAISIPLSELKKRMKELPNDREIVAYCRGPYCVLAAEAVEKLKKAGFRASRLDEGLYEWKQAGLPIE